jgi:cytoskeletal protein CcmA (bactofilin family)
MDIQDFKSSRFNIIGKKTTIKGDLFLTGRSSVEGNIEGNIFCEDDSQIIIEKEAIVMGNVNAYNVEIFGKVTGEIIAKGTLSLKPGSSVEGKIRSERLVIYPGAIVNSQADAG